MSFVPNLHSLGVIHVAFSPPDLSQVCGASNLGLAQKSNDAPVGAHPRWGGGNPSRKQPEPWAVD